MKSKKKKRFWRWKLPVIRRKEASFTVMPFPFVDTPQRVEGMAKVSPLIVQGKLPESEEEMGKDLGCVLVTTLRNSPALKFDFAPPRRGALFLMKRRNSGRVEDFLESESGGSV